MPKDHSGTVRAFHWTTKEYSREVLALRESEVDEIMFGMYAPEPGGGTTGEMSMTWINLGPLGPYAELAVYEDAWHALASFADLLALMADADSRVTSPEQFIKMLVACGFKDHTRYRQPVSPRVRRSAVVWPVAPDCSQEPEV